MARTPPPSHLRREETPGAASGAGLYHPEVRPSASARQLCARSGGPAQARREGPGVERLWKTLTNSCGNPVETLCIAPGPEPQTPPFEGFDTTAQAAYAGPHFFPRRPV